MRESSASHPCCLTPLWAFVSFSNVLTTLSEKLSNTQLKRRKLNSVPPLSHRSAIDAYTMNMVGVLKIKLKKVWGSLCDWMLLKFLTLRLVHAELLAHHQLQVRFSHFNSGFHSQVSALINHDSWYFCLYSLGQWFSLCPHFSQLWVVDFLSV